MDPDYDLQLILQGKMCPYCERESELVDSIEIYGTSYGMIYLCRPCQSWVGVHKSNETVALGRLANAELREAKKQVHLSFDVLWKKKIESGCTKHEARTAAYVWLSKELDIPIAITHIGMFDVDQCKKVVELCKRYHKI